MRHEKNTWPSWAPDGEGLDFPGSLLEISVACVGIFSAILEFLDFKIGFWVAGRISLHKTTALELVLDPIVGHVSQKREPFSMFFNFNVKKSLLQGLHFLSNNVLNGS